MVLRTCSKIAVLCLIAVSARAGGFGWWAGVQDGGEYWDLSGVSAAWTFNAADATDDSGNGHTGTVYNATSVSARFGLGWNFEEDNRDEYISIPTASIDITTNFSVAIWVYKESGSLADNDRILSLVDDASNAFQLILDNTSQKYAAYLIRGGSVKINGLTYGTFVEDSWVHMIYTVSGDTGTFYTNNVEKSSDGSIAIGAGSAGYNIGVRGDFQGTTFFDGVLDEALFYQKVLSSGERTQLYEGP